MNFIDKFNLFLYRDGTMAMARVLLGVVLGGLIGSGAGAATVGLVGAGMIGLTAMAHVGIEQAKKTVLTNFYRDEIAAVLGKAPDKVTQEDLKSMAVTPDKGGHGSYAIRAAVKDYARVRNFYIVAQAVTAALMTGGLAVLDAFLPGMPAVALAGVASLLYNELFNTVRSAGEVMTDINRGTITRDIRAINDQIELGGRISSTRVLGVLVKADPALAEDIRQRHGEPYDTLNIEVKRELVQAYDPAYHIYEITEDINQGRVNPTELAFAAYGQRSGVPMHVSAIAPFKGLGEGKSEVCGRENGQVVCRGGDGAEAMEDKSFFSQPLREQIAINEATPMDIPEPNPGYSPRDLFYTDNIRQQRLKDPYKALS